MYGEGSLGCGTQKPGMPRGDRLALNGDMANGGKRAKMAMAVARDRRNCTNFYYDMVDCGVWVWGRQWKGKLESL